MSAGFRKGVEQFKNRFSLSVSCRDSETTNEEMQANIDLVAAAPDLLATMKLIADIRLDDTGEYYSLRFAVKAAREAIKKATGK